MRFTAFILAILVLVLSCLPCADADSMTICKADIQKEVKNNSQQKDHHADLCSPFCHCACCASFSVINKDVVIPQRIEIPVCSSFVEFQSAEIIEISLPVWQPPKLV